MNMHRRVVITGLGAIGPLGTGVEKSWQALCQGKSGIAEVTRFDASPFRCKIAGEVKDFAPEDFIAKKLIRTTDRFIHFALAATQMAMEDARFQITPSNAERVGAVIGTGLGGLSTIEENHQLLLEGKGRWISPYFIPSFIANMAPGQIAIQFGAKGPSLCPVTACAAGSHAIGEAFKIIQRGDAEAMISGGAEASITPLAFSGFDALRVSSTRNHEPQKASRPFDKDRDGFVEGEGAGIVILEELQSALNRGAKIYAEIIGYGLNNDAYHVTAPSPDGEGAAQCMERALLDAGITPEEVDYINAHGTSTLLNDLSETNAIKTVFKGYCKRLPISANKSMIGHLFGAAGGIEAVFCILTIRDGVIPPTINYETPDPECDLDYVPNQARTAKVRTAISNSFGFGGVNATLVFREFNP